MSISDAIENAKAKELFDLARALGDGVEVVRKEGDGYVRLSAGDVAELLLDWATGQRLVSEGYASPAPQQTDEAAE